MSKGKRTETQPIKWKTAQTLLGALRSDENYNTLLLFGCGFYFGLRISDILQIRWKDLFSDSFILVETKTKKDRRVSVHPYIKKIANEAFDKSKFAADENDLVFIHQRSDGSPDKAISTVAAIKRIKTTFDKYGIETQNASSHTLRKTFGRSVYENNGKTDAALALLSEIFNHANTKVTRKYIGLTREVIANAYLSI